MTDRAEFETTRGSSSSSRLSVHAIAGQPTGTACRACGAERMVPFYRVGRIPVQTTVLLDTEAAALGYPTGEILLGCCERCGFIQNLLFDPDLIDYSIPTEESQAFSPTFAEFAARLADRLVDRYDLEGKSVLEVGCGKGDFLTLLADRGIRSGLGLDPGFLPNRPERSASSLRFEREWFGPELVHLTGDLVLTRHLMEHLHNVSEFLGWLRDSVSATPGAALYTEVPDTERVLEEAAFWDVYYEHCSYFTAQSLRRALEHAGFEVQWLEPGFHDQYLLAGALPGKVVGRRMPVDEEVELARLIGQFVTGSVARIEEWRERISTALDDGRQVTIWGGGSKTVAFLSALGLSDVTVVDINPFKQSKWLPAIAVEVQSPEVLIEVQPDLVIPMNPIYVGEITRDLHEMGIRPEVVPA